MPQPLMFFFAFLAVLAMIGAAAWLVRRFAGNRLGASTKSGRMPRLAVIDAAAVDGRRRLVLVRRDNIEHLLMIGGPSDIVVESNIVRAAPARDAGRPGLGVEPRLTTPDWDADAGAEAQEPSLPELPPRPTRPSFADEPRRPGPPAMPARRASEFPAPDPFAGLAPEPTVRPDAAGRSEPRAEIRPEPRAETREPRLEPAPRPRPDPLMPRPPRPELPKAPLRAERPIPPAPPAPPAAPTPAASPQPAAPSQPQPSSAAVSADQNLAEMANRLEAALRRPADAPAAAPTAPEPPARLAARAPEPPRPEPHPEPPAAAAPTKSGFESLEDEMASLLGRPKTPT
ncbi:flagellar biosynthetic protein FliO [Rhodopseudomonas palustris]|uniref:Flagellar biosynthesis protein FliO n=1 Tax=Rhodopseudomonas palustris TaxID=1076 RepID=A0A418VKH8_RHOPL|nr:flagellar biosynthetic protein FliO [Rhodopseudomonas palustris]RJF76634.1 flagellar biosynthesis protein FliO [Rhodopseudomonas palustris]